MDRNALAEAFANAPSPDSKEFVTWFAQQFNVPPDKVATMMRDHPESLMTLLDESGAPPPGPKTDFGGQSLGAAIAEGEGQPSMGGERSWVDNLYDWWMEGKPEETQTPAPSPAPGLPQTPAPIEAPPPPLATPAAPSVPPTPPPSAATDPALGDARYTSVQTPAPQAQVAATPAPAGGQVAAALTAAMQGVEIPEAPEQQVLQPPAPPGMRPIDTAASQALLARLPGMGGKRMSLGQALG
jgi:hypothetical protein